MVKKKPNIHTVHNPEGGWDNKKENAKRSSGHFDTKAEAEKAARDQGLKEKVEVLTHNMDGKIAKRNSYGNDPSESKG
jgi:hypothetical protein